MNKPAMTIFRHLLIALGAAPLALAAQTGHDHADIQRAAENAVKRQMAASGGRVEATARTLDSRLKLAQCDAPLTAELPYATTRKARITTEVRCPGSEPWKLYVPVELQIWQKVLVATGPLARGSLLSANDMVLAERTVGQQTRGFVLELDHAVGYRLKRDLSEGDIITPGVIVAPPLITRGQTVTIAASAGSLEVKMTGIALEDGLAGEMILVENRESGRKVEGIVRSGKTVEVLLH